MNVRLGSLLTINEELQAICPSPLKDIHDAECFHCSFHVVHPGEVGAFESGGGHGGEAGVEAFFERSRVAFLVGQEAAEERLSRSADQNREVGEGGDELIELGNQCEVLFL